MRTTLKKLAEEANVSLTTVSLILNGKNVRVSEDTKKNVLTIAHKYNYQPNKIAQGLVTRKSKTIGLVIPDISNSFFAESAKFIEKSIAQMGYSLILCNSNDNAKEEKKYIELLLSRGVDALIICLSQNSLVNDSYIDNLKSIDIPCVAFDRWGRDMPCSVVSVDNKLGASEIVSHLVSKGHSKIGCITGSLVGNSASARLEGYREVLEKNNIEFNKDLVFEGDYQFESGYLYGKQLIKAGATAIFACNDLMAFGVYKAAGEFDKRIPLDLAVAGFDDLFVSSMISVPLTTVKQPIEQLSAKVTEFIFKQINNESTEKHFLIKPIIALRDST